MIRVTERWKEQSFTTTYPATNWTARKVFDVSGVSDEAGAQTAQDETTGLKVPQIGDTHPLSSSLQVRTAPASRPDYTLWRVECNYAIGDFSVTGNPITEKPTIEWGDGNRTIQVDRDWRGQPIVNSAGTKYSPAPPREIGTLYLFVERNEPYFNVAGSKAFRNSVNSGAVQFQGYNFDPYTIRCTSIKPTQRYSIGAPFVRVRYSFEILNGDQGNTIPPDDWWLYLRDEGYYAYGQTGTAKELGRIVSGSNFQNEVNQPYPLDGTGKPTDTVLKVQSASSTSIFAPIANPNLPSYLQVEPYGTFKYLKWQNYRFQDFTQLGLN